MVWQLFFLPTNTWQSCALGSNLRMPLTVFTLVSVLQYYCNRFVGKISCYPIALGCSWCYSSKCPAFTMAFALTSIQDTGRLCRVNCTVFLLNTVSGWFTQMHRSLQYSIHKKRCSNTYRSFKSCSQKCWHYTIWFNFTSPQNTINIVWLIWYSKHYLCSCSRSDLCHHVTGSWNVPCELWSNWVLNSGSPEYHTAWQMNAPYLSKTLDQHPQAASRLCGESSVPCIWAQHWCGFCPLHLWETRERSRDTGYCKLMACSEQIKKSEV